MSLHHSDDRVTLHAGDSLHVLTRDVLGYDYRDGYAPPAIPDASIDAVVTDPPYGLEFMGEDWDSFGCQDVRQRDDDTFTAGDRRHGLVRHGIGGSYGGDSLHAMRAFQSWCEEWCTEALRVLKPGGHLLAFGGSRTWHRLVCGIEDAGFEVRDSLAWLYGSGFPKSLNVSKAIDKAAGAEREVLSEGKAVKRMIPGADQNKTGSWIKDNGRDFVPTVTAAATEEAAAWEGWGTALKPSFEPIAVGRKPLAGTVAATVLEHGTGALNIGGCKIEFASAADLAESVTKNQHGSFGSGPRTNEVFGTDGRDREDYDGAGGRWPANVILDSTMAAELDAQSGVLGAGNHPAHRAGRGEEKVYGSGWSAGTEQDRRATETGGASRFFLVADLADVDQLAARFFYTPKAPQSERPRVQGVSHPTVKPLAVMRWLVRLVTPPGGTVLDLFAGSGTTVEAALLEGMHVLAIEKQAKYLPLIVQRINRRLDPVAAVVAAAAADDEADLFGLLAGV